jgi:hypothetical protein
MNRKIKFLAVGAAVAATVGLGAGLVTAQTDDPTPPAPTSTTCPMHTADMDEMHSQMSRQMQGQHSGMHEHMSEMDGMNMHGTP